MVYITGDTHGELNDTRFDFLKTKLKATDTLIIAGDFGFDWNENMKAVWQTFHHKYTILFCDGNHENYDILNSLPLVEKYGDVVGDFGNNTYRLLTGHMYIIEGKKYFVFGGASSIDKDWRVIEENAHNKPRTLWWPEEVPTEEQLELAEKTLEKHNYVFDYFITHTCSPQLKAPVLKSYKADFYDPTETMINHLEYLIRENNGHWSHSFFGHFHRNVHFGKFHCLYGDIVDLSNDCYYKGWDDYSYETWEKVPLPTPDEIETIYF